MKIFEMHSFTMFIIALCVIFLMKLQWWSKELAMRALEHAHHISCFTCDHCKRILAIPYASLSPPKTKPIKLMLLLPELCLLVNKISTLKLDQYSYGQ